MSKATTKKEVAKKVEKKDEKKKETKFFNAVVDYINDRNAVVLKTTGPKKENNLAVLAYVDVPRSVKDKETGKINEEFFYYETNEILRKKLVGKDIKFELVKEMENGMKQVVPFVGKENVIVTLLEKGYASLRIKQHPENKNEHKEYFAAAEKASAAKKGMFASEEEVKKVAIKKPESLYFTVEELSKMVGKTIEGHIKKVDSPATILFETTTRKLMRVSVYAVNQKLEFDPATKNFKMDDIAKEAVAYLSNEITYHDATIKVMSVEKRTAGIVTVDGKDIAEGLLKAGFVFGSKLAEADVAVKEKYLACEKEAKEAKKGRWTNFDQAAEDAIIAKKEKRQHDLADRKKNPKKLEGEVESFAKLITFRKGDQVFKGHYASIRPVTVKDNKEFNQLLDFRIKEFLRKLMSGKKVEVKECYTRSFEDAEKKTTTVDHYYDVLVNGKNVAIKLLEKGFFTLENSRDEMYQSFDYKELSEAKVGKYEEKKITEFNASKDGIKEQYMNSVMTAVVEAVLSPTKLIIYIPDRDVRMSVLLANCRLPRDDENEALKKFNQESISELKKFVLNNEVMVDFREFNKSNFLVEMSYKKQSVNQFVLDNAFAQYAGRKENPSQKNVAAKENSTGIYQFKTKGDIKTEENAKKMSELKEYKRSEDFKFEGEKKAYIVGFDGVKVYYYNSAEDAKFIEEISTKFATAKKVPFEVKEGMACGVENKGKWYRGEVVKVAQSANVVKCIDTGVVVSVGKKKIKPTTDEIKKAPVTVKSVVLAAIELMVQGKNIEYELMVAKAQEFCNKEVSIYISGKGAAEAAKIIDGKVCMNVALVENGLALVSRSFRDKSEFGNALFKAQDAAKEAHLNIWRYGELVEEEEVKEEVKDFKGKKPAAKAQKAEATKTEKK
ncbi:hypothetical protein EIN_405260 [Entamoeba invadens IP1]|uniref:TNase-like domain-containing protein n=1 Tax=Entamoeba invadens IP1 TaxID=370355 RepID=A0A0A1U6T7_ENTIV|nr:hypothetical protein EIN_405260 [Entamoeba invadens IP1]ELP90112.1 hypothetical protein EIN_405260 [Entamoeba invadens IP1]|eukprot:XP_004256883.1 hypothetical protein EIN_405260 [Entamoeba invadens IP1]